ncbi:long-chain-fatty-acid-CoA ligase 3 [Thecamonas trahens ATCC 50062]|uniref:Long-chain-fatty-acid-CoA ligase 3 n=1 Tax=Thecamonas trahens ATCC 50062 TaxID=461836 RepID=A0A0L0D7M5_THETB|nr:long-chain-fatty-acid-CoA ligase 3 [Thecamonas trahens ATCC 50062]KNC48392.1 long-chain-fatty-acid-CoA ligase 3 [Thecamonas trahens ATCC 50062]|eukprot:XP_013758509.1 long-chain-fatty-acid-CoA ligase 3 [Thecamonas trahens ATCC 50062]
MYTSGSTGKPKGVEIEHKAVVGAVASLAPAIPGATNADVYVGYLPLAHILELCAETTILSLGASIGYGSTLTLSDTSAMIAEGTMGDLRALRPTLMAAVPLVLDRIRDGVSKKIAKASLPVRLLYAAALASAKQAHFNGWPTPLCNVLVFNKIRAAIGGRLRMMLSGGAPLSSETQTWFSTVIAPLGQGYGATETCSTGTITHPDDPETNVVGAPIMCCEFKLVDWEQYTNADASDPTIGRPRGEMWIRGNSVSRGYLGMPDKTAEDYPVDSAGIRWYATGDIGQVETNGVLRIIDRKKDLVKGGHGEYVSLGKVESALRNADVVDNVMVHQSPELNNPLAVVSVNADALRAALGAGADTSANKLVDSEDARSAVLSALKKTAKSAGLKKFETPAWVILEPTEWTPESDLVTAAQKLKRANLMKKYRNDIDKVYESL